MPKKKGKIKKAKSVAAILSDSEPEPAKAAGDGNLTENRANSVEPAATFPSISLLNVLKKSEVDEKQILGVRLPNYVFDQLTFQEIRDLKEVFDAFDADKSNTIDMKELYHAMKVLGFKVARDEVRDLMAAIDSGNQGSINFVDFLLFIIERQKDSRDVYEEIRQAFKLFDIEGNGKISGETLRNVCAEAGLRLSKKEIRDMIEIADLNGDDEIDEDEFRQIMIKTNLF